MEHGHEDGAVCREVGELLFVAVDVLLRCLFGEVDGVVGEVKEEGLLLAAFDEVARFFGQPGR